MADLSRLLFTALSRDYGALARQTRRNAVLYAVAGVLFLTAYVTGLIALAVCLARMYGAPVALAAIAFSALVIGLIVIAVAMSANRRERELQALREQLMREQAMRPASLTGAALGLVPMLTRGNPWASVLIAGLTAFAAGFTATGKRKKGE